MEADEMAGTCNTHGRDENAYRIVVGKPDRKRPLERPGHRSGDNSKMDRMVECGLDSSGSGYVQVAVSSEYGNESSSSIKSVGICWPSDCLLAS
jgi:hypothetical protein